MNLDTRVQELSGVGDALSVKLQAANITTVGELIDFYPRTYEDYSHVTATRALRPGHVTIKARIAQLSGKYVRRGIHITEAVASDDTGSVRLVWFNQPYRATSVKNDAEYYISGEFGLHYRRMSIQSPRTELVADFPLHTARIVPIYRQIRGLKSHQLRKLLQQTLPAVQTLPEILPKAVVLANKLMSRTEALQQIHFPESSDHLADAKRRLGFEEIYQLALASLLNKYELLQETSLAIPFDQKLAQQFVAQLPFKLTDAQRKVIWQIYQDMERTQPMDRLVEGDVGSGKTVVAAMASVMAMRQGFQAALMAPTELLARQHAESLVRMLQPVGMAESVGLLVGGLSAPAKKRAHERIKDGSVKLVVGTHALIQEKVNMDKLGLVVVDEQHRFGVSQRKALQAKAGHMPHILSMTATPIPRSLALTVFGDLDISIIDQLPGGRKQIITKICSPNSRAQLYKSIDEQLQAGRQMFVVCPLITESDSLRAQSAEKVYESLRKGPFKHRRIALLHGKMKPDEKDQIMQDFVQHTYDILVATTVIEVGVDVPNATVMLIESAERFGLAQMHQLRGRVGRSEHQGYCYLMLSESGAPPQRLRAIEQTTDGFRLAELDLELRGPGAVYGTMQHGQLDLRMASLSDTKLIAAARKAAQEFIDKGENLVQYKELYARVQNLRSITNIN